MPLEFHPYITRTKDVASDGHCGFRAIAALLGFGENAWARVRRDLLEELTNFEEEYKVIFVETEAVNQMKYRLNCFEETAFSSHWMDMPEMGYLVASRYNVAVVSLSPTACFTLLPLRTAVVEPPKCICIGFVNQNHFIQVRQLNNRQRLICILL